MPPPRTETSIAPDLAKTRPGPASMNGRERILAHLEGEAVDRLPLMPITMQLAADLLGVRYRDYETDYRLLTEGQIRTAEAFGFDYVNTMSDPGREAADCGARLEFFDDQPAAIVEDAPLLADRLDLARLKQPDPLGGGRMHNGVLAVAELRRRVGRDLLVEGWVEGPCAEGADLRGLNALMLDFFDDGPFVHDLFAFCVEMGLRFAKAQIEAGADLIGIGDAAVSLVGPRIYQEFIWPHERRLIEGIHAMGGRTRLHICGNTRSCLAGMGRLGCHIIDLDSLAPLDEARQRMGERQILLGNLNPVATLRNATPEKVLEAIEECHAIAGQRFIVGAGCEVPRDTPPANLHVLRDYARTHRP
ncbi:MAG: uroporphyrinogen decarboxylase family protein [Verrucomicrobiales bacterium]|nr:uroporphyrinogen decarboxylase family protein [Verrucomicrobiales bacterium]